MLVVRSNLLHGRSTKKGSFPSLESSTVVALIPNVSSKPVAIFASAIYCESLDLVDDGLPTAEHAVVRPPGWSIESSSLWMMKLELVKGRGVMMSGTSERILEVRNQKI